MLKYCNEIATYIALALFIASLAMPTFGVHEDAENSWGMGWVNLTVGIFSRNPTWWANPFIIASWFYLFKKNRISIALSIVACLLALSLLWVTELMISTSGETANIKTYLVGYWFWLCSIVISLIGSILLIPQSKKYPEVDYRSYNER
ncbi:MAG: hypothetical protein MI810_02085 [Flavobacteriales bacterium]|nr:hypothetical protein [Flavobacteriales bacterium]